MKHFQKIITYFIVIIISFIFIQTDLLSQNDSLVNKDTLTIGGFYKITLISGEVISGEIQSYNPILISVISDENVINIKQEQIKSIEIPKIDYHTESSFGDLQNWDSYWSIGVTGGGMIPIGEFGDRYDFSGSISADIIYHFNPHWAVYADVVYNSLSYKEQDYSYSWNYYPSSYNSESSSLLELTIGPRYYIVWKKVRVHGDAGLGFYSLNTSPDYYANTSFGINFGLGALYNLIEKLIFFSKQSIT